MLPPLPHSSTSAAAATTTASTTATTTASPVTTSTLPCRKSTPPIHSSHHRPSSQRLSLAALCVSQFAVTDSPPVRTSNAQSSERERGEGGSEVVEREREREAPVSRRKPCARNRPRLYSLHSSDRPSQASLLLDNDKDDLGPSICV